MKLRRCSRRRGRNRWGPSRAVVAALAVGLAGLATLGGAIAAAFPVRDSAGGGAVKVVDNGFRPPANGFKFPNYGNNPAIPNLGPEEMQTLFGSAVCASGSGAACVLSPPALAWMQEQNAAMADGHCLGFSVAALLFHAGTLSPSQFGADSVPGLAISGNSLLAREIAYGWTFQLLPSVTQAAVHGAPSVVLAKLESALQTGGELYTLAITKPGGAAGHAVTPFEVKRTSLDHYAVLVYDNNYPAATRKVLINTQAETWTYQAAPTPGQPASTYNGNATSDTLYLLPTRPGLGVQPCPFCSAPASAPASAPTGATAARADGGRRQAPRGSAASAARFETIDLQIDGAASGTRLVITDRAGHRFGFVGKHLIDTIPGARVVPLLSASPRTWLDGSADQFVVPAGQAYRISLSHPGARGKHGRRLRGTRAAGAHASIVVLGPGFVAAVHTISDGTGATSSVEVPATGNAVTFTPGGGATQEPELVIGTGQPGTTGHEWNVLDLGTSGSQPVSATLDPATETVAITGGGTYDVSLDSVGSSVNVFGYNDLTLGDGVTATVDYAGAAPGASLPVTDTVDGAVTGTAELSDEPSAFDQGTAFSDPGEGVPLAEPSGPTSDDSTTAVSCSPDSISVDAQTTCSAAVSSDDGVVPTGLVAFDSTGGNFDDDTCTLDATGACAVTFTAAAVGSQAVDAVYGGDDVHVSSDDTTEVDVGLRATVTDLSCAPNDGLSAGDSTTCTATVTDDASGTVSAPTGAVTFASDDPDGSFPDGTSCALAATDTDGVASCSIAYTVGSDTTPTDTLSASYGGDSLHASS